MHSLFFVVLKFLECIPCRRRQKHTGKKQKKTARQVHAREFRFARRGATTVVCGWCVPFFSEEFGSCLTLKMLNLYGGVLSYPSCYNCLRIFLFAGNEGLHWHAHATYFGRIDVRRTLWPWIRWLEHDSNAVTCNRNSCTTRTHVCTNT